MATAVCTALKLPADATPEAVTAACTTLRTAQPDTPDPARFVPIESVTALQGQIAALTARQVQADVEAQIKPALADGRLLPGWRPGPATWARRRHRCAHRALTAAKPIAALAGTQTGGKAPMATASGDQQLSADGKRPCATPWSITPGLPQGEHRHGHRRRC